MIGKNIRLLNKDLQVLYQYIEFNKEFKIKKIHIGSYKTINAVGRKNLSVLVDVRYTLNHPAIRKRLMPFVYRYW